jgi:hypothetical protein
MKGQMTMKIIAGMVYDVSFRCDTPGPEIDEGSIRAYWTGEVEIFGKLIFRPVDGSPVVYLFRREIVALESNST